MGYLKKIKRETRHLLFDLASTGQNIQLIKDIESSTELLRQTIENEKKKREFIKNLEELLWLELFNFELSLILFLLI